MPKSPRLIVPVASRPMRVLPKGSTSEPPASAVSVIGFVVPRSVRSPVISYSSSSVAVIEVDSNVISGWFSASKKSGASR
jgi:hypothetical protein